MPCLDDTRSLFVFGIDNCFRSAMIRVINSKAFFIVVLAAILINSIVLAANQPRYPAPEWATDILYWSEVGFISIFGLEMLIKIVALGLVLHPESYLRDPWNVFDVFVIGISIVALTTDLNNISALRTFRVLRPLRTVSHIKQLKTLLNALFLSVPDVTTTFLFLVYFIFFVALVGLNLWSGDLSRRCYYPPDSPYTALAAADAAARVASSEAPLVLRANESALVTTVLRKVIASDRIINNWTNVSAPGSGTASPSAAPSALDSYNWTDAARRFTPADLQIGRADVTLRPCGGKFSCPYNGTCMINTTQFDASPFSFNDIGSSMLMVFKITILDDWSDEMNNAIDAVGYGAIAFYVIIVILGGFSLIQIFLAILMSEYNAVVTRARRRKAKEQERQAAAAERARQKELESSAAAAAAAETGNPMLTSPKPDEFGVVADELTEVQPFDAVEGGATSSGGNNGGAAAGGHDHDDAHDFLIGAKSQGNFFASVGAHSPGTRSAATSRPASPASHTKGSNGATSSASTEADAAAARRVEAEAAALAAAARERQEREEARERHVKLFIQQRQATGDLEDCVDLIDAPPLVGNAGATTTTPPTQVLTGGKAPPSTTTDLRWGGLRNRLASSVTAAAHANNLNATASALRLDASVLLSEGTGSSDVSSSTSSDDEARGGSSAPKLFARKKSAHASRHELQRARTFGRRFDSDDSDLSSSTSSASSSTPSSSGGDDGGSRSSSAGDASGDDVVVGRGGARAPKAGVNSARKYLAKQRTSAKARGNAKRTGDKDKETAAADGDPLQSPLDSPRTSDAAPAALATQDAGGGGGGESSAVKRGRRKTVVVDVGRDAHHLESTATDHSSGSGASDGEDSNGTSAFRLKLQRFAALFFGFMMVVTVINVGVLAADHFGIDPAVEQIFDNVSLICTALFIVELLLRLAAFGIISTFSDPFNVLDFVLIALAVFEFFFAFSGTGSSFTAFRALRAFRVLRLAGRISSVHILIESIAPSVVPALLVCLLLLIFLYIFAVLGMQLFGDAAFGVARVNYGTIWDAALSNFIVVTGEQWGNILAAGMRINPIAAPIFFVALFAIGNFVVLNLLTAVVIEQLDNVTNAEWERERSAQRLELAGKQFPPRLILPPVIASLKRGGSSVHQQSPNSSTVGGILIATNSTTASARSDGGAAVAVKRASAASSAASSPVSSPRRGVGGVRTIAAGAVNAVNRQMMSFFRGAKRVVVASVVLQGRALLIFGPSNCVRRVVAAVALSHAFRYVSVVVTAANVLLIAIQGPNDSEQLKEIQHYAELGFAGFYGLEVLLGALARGVFFPRNEIVTLSDGSRIGGVPERLDVVTSAYFSNISNVLNFLVALTAGLGIYFPWMRYARAIRAMKLVTFFPSLRVAFTALMQAIPHMFVSFLFCVILWVVFCIFGVQILKGSLYYCTDPTVTTQAACVGNFTATQLDSSEIPPFTDIGAVGGLHPREWKPYLMNFDHIGFGMVSLLTVALGEDWPDVMFLATDAVAPGEALKHAYNPYLAIFFVVFVVIGNFLTFSLMLGVLINFFIKFKKAADGTMLLSTNQRMYLLTKRIVEASMFETEISPPGNCFRRVFFALVTTTISDLCPSAPDPPEGGEDGAGGGGGPLIAPGGTPAAAAAAAAATPQKQLQQPQQQQAAASPTPQKQTPASQANRGRPTKRTRKGKGKGRRGGKGASPSPQARGGNTAVARGGAQQSSPQQANQRRGRPNALRRFASNAKHMVLDEEPVFELVMAFVAIVNAVALAAYRHNMPQLHREVLDIAHFAFMCLFGAEVVLKVIAQLPTGYFGSFFNRIDFVATAVMIAGYFFEEQMGRAAYIARIARIARTFKHFMRGESAQKQFAVIIHGLPSLFNLVCLLAVMFFVFGVVGVDLFGTVRKQGSIDDVNNFEHLWGAFLVLFQSMSTENWHNFMMSCMVSGTNCDAAAGDCGTVLAYPYFLSFVLVSNVIMLQLCVAIVVEHFEDTTDGAENSVISGMSELRSLWRDVAGTTGVTLTLDKALIVLMRLPRKLTQLEAPVTPRKVFFMLLRMRIPVEPDLTVSYRATVLAVLRNHFAIDPVALEGVSSHFASDMPDGLHFSVGHLIAARIIWQRWKEHKEARSQKRKK